MRSWDHRRTTCTGERWCVYGDQVRLLALHAACRSGHASCIEPILNARPPRRPLASEASRARDNGDTLLIVAAGAGHVTCVSRLLEAGAKANQSANNLDCTPLFVACQHGHIAVVQELLAPAERTACEPPHALSGLLGKIEDYASNRAAHLRRVDEPVRSIVLHDQLEQIAHWADGAAHRTHALLRSLRVCCEADEAAVGEQQAEAAGTSTSRAGSCEANDA